MANEKHLKLLRRGIDAWNKWRHHNWKLAANLRWLQYKETNDSQFDLKVLKIQMPDLSNSNLRGWNLRGADFRAVDLTGVDFSRAHLLEADFDGATLEKADLQEAMLGRAIFKSTKLDNCNLSRAVIHDITFYDIDLSTARGLDDCRHLGPSCVDGRTLTRSKNVPIQFWHGCGVPDRFIDCLPSLAEDAAQFYSCFISYSSKDQEFANRLHTDLQNASVRCWFAPQDLPIGAKTWDGIDEAIKTRDKVLLILSEDALTSDWVEDEVTTAFAEERRRKELVLFPVRLDEAVMASDEPWARKLRDNRNIGDFSNWKEHGSYKATFERVLRDLMAKP